MSRFALLFGLGVFFVYRLPGLPGWPAWAMLGGVALLLAGLPRWRFLLAVPAGFAWALAHAAWTQPVVVAAAETPAELRLHGYVDSLVQRKGPLLRFLFQVEALGDTDADVGRPWRVRLTWRDGPPLAPGDRLQLSARIRPVHGFASPGAWDYEGWLYRQGVRYRGYVLAGDPPSGPREACCPLARMRSGIAARIDGLPVSGIARGVLRALTVGDRTGLSPGTRELFQATGTSHLMAISGLHVGLVATLALVTVAAVWRRVPSLTARVPSRVAAAVGGLLLGTLYALLAGLSLPTQRALIMLVIAAGTIVLRREARPSSVLALAATCVLVRDPSSIVAAGFWLSFGAVATILGVTALVPRQRVWQSVILIQLAISVALWPLLVLFGLPVPAVSPAVNLILVPLFAFLVVPASLIGSTLLIAAPSIGVPVLIHVATLIDLIVALLDRVEAHAREWLLPAMPGWAETAAVVLAIAVLLAPRGFPLRWLAVPLLSMPWLPHATPLGHGDFNLHVLDTGQGLSVVVETAGHTLVYDTGPRYPSGFSTAQAVVLPFLHARRRTSIDRLILSHGDSDHAGGAAVLRNAIPVGRIDSGEPARTLDDAKHCRQGDEWEWEGVSFAVLYPFADGGRAGNNASCVLRVGNGSGVALLTGDIETVVERVLVERMARRLRSDIVVVPHHGSRTSSSEVFVDAVRPRYAVYTTGWFNRYGFPAAEVDSRWRAVGARRLNTASAGTVSIAVSASDGIGPPVCHRVHQGRFWWHDGGSADACHEVSSGRRATSPGP